MSANAILDPSGLFDDGSLYGNRLILPIDRNDPRAEQAGVAIAHLVIAEAASGWGVALDNDMLPIPFPGGSPVVGDGSMAKIVNLNPGHFVHSNQRAVVARYRRGSEALVDVSWNMDPAAAGFAAGSIPDAPSLTFETVTEVAERIMRRDWPHAEKLGDADDLAEIGGRAASSAVYPWLAYFDTQTGRIEDATLYKSIADSQMRLRPGFASTLLEPIREAWTGSSRRPGTDHTSLRAHFATAITYAIRGSAREIIETNSSKVDELRQAREEMEAAAEARREYFFGGATFFDLNQADDALRVVPDDSEKGRSLTAAEQPKRRFRDQLARAWSRLRRRP